MRAPSGHRHRGTERRRSRSTSGRRWSTCCATRAGGATRRGTARTRYADRASWPPPTAPGCAATHPEIWRTAPVLKHFLAYNVETARDTIDVAVPERVLHEYELPAFRGPIRGRGGGRGDARLQPGQRRAQPRASAARRALRALVPDLVICSDAQAPSNLVEIEQHFPDHVRVARRGAAGRAGQLYRQRRRRRRPPSPGSPRHWTRA